MKRRFLIQAFILVFLSCITGCYDWVGGYRGPLYHWTRSDIIYLDTRKGNISFSDTLQKIAALFITKGKNGILDEKCIASSNDYQIPLPVFREIENEKCRIQVFSAKGTAYALEVNPKQWQEKVYVFGYPINDVQNDSEMMQEVKKEERKMNDAR